MVRTVCSGTGSRVSLRLFQHRALRLEHVDAVLRKVADAWRCGRARARPAARSSTPAEQLKQRGFAGAVRADQHGALAALGLEVDPAINHIFAIGVMDALRRVITRSPLRGGCGKAEMDRLLRRLGRLDFVHPLDLLELALGLRGLAGLGAEAIGESWRRRSRVAGFCSAASCCSSRAARCTRYSS